MNTANQNDQSRSSTRACCELAWLYADDGLLGSNTQAIPQVMQLQGATDGSSRHNDGTRCIPFPHQAKRKEQREGKHHAARNRAVVHHYGITIRVLRAWGTEG